MMRRLTLFLVTAILAISAAPTQAEPVTKIVTTVKQVWVQAQYWNCTLTYATAQLSDCVFKFNRWVWLPEAAWCGLRNIGSPDDPYPVTVCWLHHRQIIGPRPLPPGIVPAG